MFVPTSRKFYDLFTGTGGGGVNYLNSCQGDKVTAVIEGYFYWATEHRHLIFDSASKTIIFYSSGSGQNDSYSFITDGFKEGDTFDVSGTISNDGNYTITSISDRIITTTETLVTEDAGDASLFGTTPITAIDFYYNLVENSEKLDFNSSTDIGTQQRYAVGNIDSADISTNNYFDISSQSFGWVSDIENNGTSTESFVKGAGIVLYKQHFIITHVFYQAAIWTKEVQTYFAQRALPPSFQNGKALKHIYKVDGKFEAGSPVVDHTGGINNSPGAGSWFNQPTVQDRKEYSVSSITYQNNVTSEYLQQLQGDIVNLVTVVMNSRSGKFVANTSLFNVAHFQCPLNQSEYIDTETTLLQNIKYDSALATSDQAAINGINYGTDYQSIKDIQVVWFSANLVTVTFKVDYSLSNKIYLKTKADTDRYYSITVECQDIAITTTKGIDRVNVICDFNNADYDQRESTIFGLQDYIHGHRFPNYGVYENSNITGYEGDPAYVEIPFWMETSIVNNVSPTLMNVEVQIIAVKTGDDDFILESKKFDTSLIRKLNDKQTINIEDSRNFILPNDSPFNRANVIRYSEIDSGSKKGYNIQYAFVLRYEYWIDIVQSQQGASFDVFKNIENVNELWSQYSQGNGWGIKFRMNAQVKGYSGEITNFTTQTDVIVLSQSDAPTLGQTWMNGDKYFTFDGKQVDGIIENDVTRIVAIYKGDPTDFPTDFYEFFGYIFLDNNVTGGVSTRRLACTDFDSEEDSPFSSIDLPENNALSTEQSANLRLSIFDNRIELDTFYTDNPQNGLLTLIGHRLGNNGKSILLQENGYALLQETGDYILLE